MADEALPGQYDPQDAAARWTKAWTDAQLYVADPSAPGEPFSIVIPPPNVTGSLHMGHAFEHAIIDTLVRYKRMDGYNVLWLPGTDHAGIATQWVVRRQLEAQGVDYRDLGRDAFVDKVWEWKAKSGGRIQEQMRALGASCDWTRDRFTLDPKLAESVTEHFVKLYEQGLIYRGERLINWDPVDQTALSDLEVESEPFKGELYSFAYPLSDGSGEVVVATTRPETMLGDTAIAVHPDDARYQHLIGKTVRHPFVDREIPIIADPILVDPTFGSGCVKITPAHDFNDFEVGKRHKLPMINIMNRDGTLNDRCGDFAGLDRFVARDKIKERLAALELDRGTEPNQMTLPKSQRSKAIVEPLLSTQWFVSMKPLAGPALAAVELGATKFVPEQWQNTYYAWLRDIRDWCISRQLWWGHRIPAWYDAEGKVYVARTLEEAIEQAGTDQLTQDDDVLDTWFSSALWPFSTMGWPERTEDLDKYYPTSVLVTGFDIIFFWVARMMFAGLHFTGQVPFKDVYIHALIRDAKGEKMSKTKGNVIDPLDVVETYGVDAFRFTLLAMGAQGRDIRWKNERVSDYSRFIMKIWQSLRFSFLTAEGYDASAPMAPGVYQRWIAARADAAAERVRAALDTYKFNEAAQEIYAFVWGEFCDWYLELSKPLLYDDNADPARKNATQHALFDTLRVIVRLLHPFMPFLSEEIWSRLPGTEGFVAVAPYPAARAEVDQAVLDEVALLQDTIVSVRNIRGEMQISPKVPLRLVCLDAGMHAKLTPHVGALQSLARVELVLSDAVPAAAATAVVRSVELFVPIDGIVDVADEVQRLNKVLKAVAKDVAYLGKKLGNEKFVSRAPEEVVGELREKLVAAEARQDLLTRSRDRLQASLS